MNRRQAPPGSWQPQGKACKLFEVEGGEGFKSLRASVGELEPDDAMIVRVTASHNQARGVGSIYQLDSAVVPKKEIVSNLAHGRAPRVAVASNREKQLVLGRSQANGPCLLIAPALEVAKPRPQGQQARVVVVGEAHRLTIASLDDPSLSRD